MQSATNLATVSINPFSAERHLHEWQQGETVEDILRACQPNIRVWDDAHVFLGDIEVPRKYWHVVHPKPCLITISVMPQDSGILRSVAFIALAVASAYTGGLAGGIWGGGANLSAGVISAGVSAGVFAVGALAINALIPIAPPQLENGEDSSQSLSVAAARNRFEPFGVLPVLLGRMRIVPPYAARPYTENSGDQQYAVMLFALGQKPIEVDTTSIMIGDTPLTSYDTTPGDVEVELDTGGSDDTGITMFSDTVFEELVDKVIPGGTEDGYAQHATVPDVDRVTFTIQFPLGLIKYDRNDDGIDPRTVNITVEYSSNPNGPWTPMQFKDDSSGEQHSGVVKFKAQSPQPITRGFTWTNKPFGNDSWNIRMRGDLENFEGKDDTIKFTKRTFHILRSYNEQNPIQESTAALMALKIRATDQLNGMPDQVSMVATRIAPDFPNDWQERPTNSPAALARYILTGPANARPLDLVRLDMQSFEDFWFHCAINEYEFNQYIDYNSTVQETLSTICRSAFARPLQDIDGTWSIFIDEPQSADLQIFTPRNSYGFSMSKVFPDEIHAFRMRYIDEAQDYINSEQMVYADGYDSTSATNIEALEAIGVTQWRNIFKYGRRYLAIAKLQPETATLYTDAKSIVGTVGDRIGYQDDAIKVGLGSGRVKVIDQNTVTLDAEMPSDGVSSYAIKFVLPDGQIIVEQIVTPAAGNTDTFDFSASLGAAPANVGDLAIYGVFDAIVQSFQVKNIEPISDLAAKLTLVPYDDAIYNSDTDPIPDYDPVITQPPGASSPIMSQATSDEYVMWRDAAGNLQPRILVTLAFVNERIRVNGIVVQFRIWQPFGETNSVEWETLELLPADAGLFSITNVGEGQQIEIRARYVFSDGHTGTWSYYRDPVAGTDYHTVVGKSNPPPDLMELRVIAQASGLREYRWKFDPNELLPPDLDGFEIRYWDLDNAPPGEQVSFTMMNGDNYVMHNTDDYALMYTEALPDWGDMTPLTVGRITHEPFEYNAPFSGGYLFAAVALDVGGLRSVNPVYTDRIDLPPPQLGNSLFYFDAFAARWLEGDTPGAEFGTSYVDPTTGYLVGQSANTWTAQGTWDGGNGTWTGPGGTEVDWYMQQGVLSFQQPYTSNIRLQSTIQVTGGNPTVYWSADGDLAWKAFDDGDIIDMSVVYPAGISSIEFRLDMTNVPAEGVRNWVVEGYASA